ncbi:MAG: hypothetical protein H7267_12005, partial [Sandarakinorhabdus sp.]|nr:hypothetical protein [Sandarakinorhabdus sp.]
DGNNAGLNYGVVQTVGSGQPNISVIGVLAFGRTGTVPSSTTYVPPAPALTTVNYSGGGFGDAGIYTVQIDALGYPVRTTSIREGTATVTNGTVTTDYVIGRYANGTEEVFNSQGTTTSTTTYGANDGRHFAFARMTPPALPTSGTAQFGFTSFTTPTFAGRTLVTAATLTGGISIAFGAQPKYGIAGILALTEAGSVQRYEFQSTGGVSTPSLFGLLTAIPVATTDSRCATNCVFVPNFAVGGATANIIAGSYQIGTSTTNSFTNLLTGAAVASSATPIGAAPAIPNVPTTLTGQALLSAGFSQINGASPPFTVLAFDGGRLENFTGPAFQAATATRGTALNNESGSVPGVLGWTRWAGGVTGKGSVAATNGEYYIWGTPSASLPTTGVATYALIGSTAPTAQQASNVAPGIVRSASLGVDFFNQTVGLSALIGINSIDYTLATKGGGAINPILPITRGTFTGLSDLVGVTGGNCSPTTSTCTPTVNGFFAGANGGYVGIAYNLGGGTGSTTGTLAFGQTTLTPSADRRLTGQVFTGTNTSYSTIGAPTITTVVASNDGRLTSFVAQSNTITRGATANNENGGIADVIGWTRWADSAGNPSGNLATPTNGGQAFIWGSPATAVPTSGVATYTKIGATAPQYEGPGGQSLGTVRSASLAVAFDTRRVGAVAVIAAGGNDYSVTTAGGLAAPSIALTTTNTFSGSGSVTGGAITAATPIAVTLGGFLAGPGANAAGLSYLFRPTSATPNTAIQVQGTIAFAKAP